jgi:tetratricopeptide (TPR) repeat protein
VSGAGPGWEVTHLDDLDQIRVAGVVWRPVRRRLGISAFGVNAYTAERVGAHVIEEHNESNNGAGGHEELYIVLRGRATFTVDGESRDAPAGTMVFLRDPAVTRSAVAEEEGTVVLAIGGEPGEAYQVSPWEHYFAAAVYLEQGSWDRAIETIEAGLEQYPNHPSTLYNLACAESLGGRTADAIAHLEQAIAVDGRLAERAAADPDFDPIRAEPGFPKA